MDAPPVAAMVALHPTTGAKHQLRVFCSSVLGAPIVGDALYGGGPRDDAAAAALTMHAQWQQQRGKLGQPLRVGWPFAGGDHSHLSHTHLHARSLAFPHPMDQSVTVRVQAPPPAWMRAAAEAIGCPGY